MVPPLPELDGSSGSAFSDRWSELVRAIEQAATLQRHRPDLPRLLDYVLRKIGDMVEVTWAAAWLFDPFEDSWVIAASLGLTPQASGLRLRSGTALPCRVGERGTPLLVNDLEQEEFHRVSEEHMRMRSALYAPMHIGQRTVGVLAVYSDRKDAYAPRDLELLTAVGEHLGVAVAFAVMEDRTTQIATLEERDRQARDLHDGIHQVLSSLRIYAFEARKSLVAGDVPETIALLDELTGSIDEAADELREEIAALRHRDHSYLDVYQTAPRLRRRLEAAGVATSLSLEPLMLAPSASDALAWICRESANNILKHSNAHNVTIELLSEGDHAVLAVRDDGIGIQSSQTQENGLHIGLDVMRERAGAVEGTLSVESVPEGGTRVECRLPMTPSP